MASIVALLPALLQILGWVLGKSNASNETRQAFFDFMHAIDLDTNSSAVLRQRAIDQKARILKGIEDEKTSVPK